MVSFTNSNYANIRAGQPFTLSWTGQGDGTVTIWLLKGPANAIQRDQLIGTGLTGSSFIWNVPSTLPSDTYALEIDPSNGGPQNYSVQFPVLGAVSSATSSQKSTSSQDPSKTASTSTLIPTSISTLSLSSSPISTSTSSTLSRSGSDPISSSSTRTGEIESSSTQSLSSKSDTSTSTLTSSSSSLPTTTTTTGITTAHQSALTTGAKAGIGVGAVLGVFIILGLFILVFYFGKRTASRSHETSEEVEAGKAELSGTSAEHKELTELGGDKPVEKSELPSSNLREKADFAELSDTAAGYHRMDEERAELDGSRGYRT